MRTSGFVLGGIAALAGLLAASRAAAQPPPAAPAMVLLLGPGVGTATPCRTCCSHTGGGNVLVTQPAADTIATSMTGVVVAKSTPLADGQARYTFELTQDFEVVLSDARVRAAKLLMEARVVGLLRTPQGCCRNPDGSASVSIPAHAAVSCGPEEILTLTLPPGSVSSGESLSVYNREGPVGALVAPGKYTLHEAFGIQAMTSKWGGTCHGPSAEFAPDGALDPRWISSYEPFHGAIKSSFGFQVILKLVPAEGLNPPGPVPSVPPAEAKGIAFRGPRSNGRP